MDIKEDKSLKVFLFEANSSDVKLIHDMLRKGFTKEFEFKYSDNLKKGTKKLNKDNADVILLDLNLSDSRGEKTFDQIYEKYSNIPIIIVSGRKDKKAALNLVDKGAQDYLVKGVINGDVLNRVVNYSIERKENELKIKHINSVLKALRNINKLITKERNRFKLLKEACKTLVDTKGYLCCWIALYNQTGGLEIMAKSGVKESFNSLKKLFSNNKYPDCINKLLKKDSFTIVQNPEKDCKKCPIINICENRSRFLSKLKYDKKNYGIISVSISRFMSKNKGEQELFKEISSDIAFGLHAIQAEEEQEKTKQELKESEKKYRRFFKTSKDCAFITTEKGKWIDFNDACVELFGYDSREELKNIKIKDLYADPKNRNKHIKKIKDKGFTRANPVDLKRKDRTVINTLISTVGIKYGKKKVNAFQGTITDITENKRTEKELKKSKKHFEKLFNTMVDPVIIVDKKGKLLEITDKIEEITGFEKENFIGKNFIKTKIATPKSKALMLKNLNKRMMGKKLEPYEIEIIAKDGEIIPFEINATEIKYKGKKANMVVLRDIAARKTAEEGLKESERRLSTLMSNLPGMAYRCKNDRNWTMEFLSEGVVSITGYKSEDLVNNKTTSYGKVIHPDDKEMVWERVQQVLESKNPFTLTYRIMTKKNEIRWVWEQGRGVFTKSGDVDALEGFIVDITNRKRAEENLKKSEEKYRNLFETMEQGVVYQNKEGKIISLNPAAERILGITFDQMLGRTSMDPRWKAVKEDKTPLPGVEHPAMIALKTGNKVENFIQGVFNPEKNDYVWIIVNSIPQFRKGEDKPYQVYSTFLDITERKRAEEKLKESKQNFSDIYESVSEGIAYTTLSGDVISVNKSLEKILEIPKEEIINKNILNLAKNLLSAKYFKNILPVLENLIHGKKIKMFQVDFRNKTLEIDATINKKTGRITGVIRDITERKQAEKELEEREELLSNVFESMQEGVLVLDTNFKYTYWNRGMERISNVRRNEVLGQTPWEKFSFVKGEIEEKMKRAMTGKVSQNIEVQYTLPDGEKGWTFESYFPLKNANKNIVGVVGIIEDITERKRAEQEREKLQEQLLRSQKMEALGRFTGGVAHDFNNLLTVISGYSNLLYESFEENEPRREKIEEIIKSAEKASDLTGQLLSFSKRQPLEPEFISINSVFEDLEKMINRIIGENIKLETDFSKDLEFIQADKSQIEQIIMNLIVNAHDAMPEGGKLIIKTVNIIVDKEKSKKIPESRPGKYIHMSISDTGVGMSEEIKTKLFEPFFTTKKEGTGLGLSVVYGIVEKHNGWIEVKSEKGEGTTFNIYFPASKKEPKKESDKTKISKIKGKGQIILVVEDESGIRNLIKSVLKNSNYKALTAENISEAKKIFKKNKNKINVLLSDVVLPDGDGIMLADAFKSLNKDLKVILTSGYTEEKSKSINITQKGYTFIKKPFKPQKLLSTIKKVLS